MIQYNVFPDGKKRIVTFSYDDGADGDVRLVALFDRYGVKGTFHLNSQRFAGWSEDEMRAFGERYRRHEIACHTVQHGWPARMPSPSLIGEVMEDRRRNEIVNGGEPVIGMSYPSGSYNAAVEETMRACGIVYSRTTKDTGGFALPEDFLAWHPTCHHRAALPLCERFMRSLDSEWTHPLLYIWGHSHEFRTEEDWAKMEQIVRTVAGDERIWYAANRDIWQYMTAQSMLLISADETVFTNPTAIDLWVEKDKKQIIRIPAGQTVRAE